jgi:hypothetical protein
MAIRVRRFGRCRWWYLPSVVGVSLGVVACLCLKMAAREGRVPPRPAPDAGGAGRGVAGRDEPLRIEPTFAMPEAVGQEVIRRGLLRLDVERPRSAPEVLHLLRLFTHPVALPNYSPARKAELLSLLFDHDKSRECFRSQPALIDTREGVRARVVARRDARWQRERQAHADQLLAVVAELGVPLSHPVTTAGGRRRVQHILDDALANFDPAQPEIEWSALAFVLYLPPGNRWADKYGTAHTLDELARALLSRPFEESLACAGTHLLYTLVMMLRADERVPVLSRATRGLLRAHLARTATAVARAQAPDGSWDPAWFEQLHAGARAKGLPEAPLGRKVLVTGHQVEWLLYLPPEMLPPRDCFVRAARWLQVHLLGDGDNSIQENYCPYCHAGRVLHLLGRGTASAPEPARAGPSGGAAVGG